MRRTLIVFAGLALAGTWFSATVVADGQSTHPGGRALVDRLDEFGRKLFEGVLPIERRPQPQTSNPRVVPRQFSTGRVASPSSEPRAGSAVGPDTQHASSNPTEAEKATPMDDTEKPSANFPASRSETKPTAESARQVETSVDSRGAVEPASPANSAASTKPSAARLHERLKHFGESAFPEITPPASEGKDASAVTTPQAKSASPEAMHSPESPTPAADTQPPAVARRTMLGRRFGSGPAASYPISAQSADQQSGLTPTVADPLPDEEAEASQPDAEPAAQGQSVLSGPDADDSPADEPDAGPESSVVSASPKAKTPSRSVEPRETDTLLFSRQSPILDVKTTGPRRITVGKPSTYEVTIGNSSQVAADQLVVIIDLPQWTEVLETEVSKGAVTSPPPGAEGAGFRWALGRLDGAAEEKLALRILPRQSQPFNLAVKWDYTPIGSQAMIEVQEPKLEMRLDGPREVLYGESEVYRLQIANSGTGDAENVEISLVPIGTGENVPATHKLGTVKAGEEKTIEVELTARQSGTLTIQVDARADAGVEANLTEKVAVYRPALQIDLQAPELQYVGTDVAYQIRVSNPGTAPAKNVAVTATIPPGVKYVSSTGGGKVSTDQKGVTWTLERLDVGTDKTFAVTCNLAQAGSSRLEAAASAAGDLTASGDVAVKVEAIADLALDVTDPSGPVPIGTEATYQVRVRNRGTKSAQEVEVVAYFSDGIEPTAVKGGRHETAAGQVLFDTIPSLAAGQDVTFQIKAKAGTPGNHVCRVEVYCKPLGTRLVSEETTYFYGNAGEADDGPSPRAAQDDSAGTEEAIRTAEQRPAPASPKNQ